MLRLFPLFALPLLAPAAHAESLVQVSLEGVLDIDGGARIEIEVGAQVKGQPTSAGLDLHLADETTGADLVRLLADRLTASGMSVIQTTPSGQLERAQIFIHATNHVSMRLGNGLLGMVTTCEEAPTLLRVAAPQARPDAADLAVTVSTMHPHTGKWGRKSLELPLESEAHGAQISDRLFRASMENKWISERPGTDAWRPMRMGDGAEITGFSVRLQSLGDWSLEVRLD